MNDRDGWMYVAWFIAAVSVIAVGVAFTIAFNVGAGIGAAVLALALFRWAPDRG